MPKLLHFPLDPLSRRLRLALAEYGVAFELVEERPWTPSETLFNFNPAGIVPVFVEDGEIGVLRGAAPDEIDGAPKHVDDIAPEIDDDGGKRSEIGDHVGHHALIGPAGEGGNQNQMAGRGNGEKFGGPLNEGKHNNLLK